MTASDTKAKAKAQASKTSKNESDNSDTTSPENDPLTIDPVAALAKAAEEIATVKKEALGSEAPVDTLAKVFLAQAIGLYVAASQRSTGASFEDLVALQKVSFDTYRQRSGLL